jgi:threonine synthase
MSGVARPVLMERFRSVLPLTAATPMLTLGEGATPLVRAPRLGASLGASDLWLKVEGANPTGSFKDRGMVVAVAKALESGARAVVCASTGNTSASAAAYAAAAGIEAVVLLPAGKIAAGKLLQAFAAGAKVISIRGNFDDALDIVRELGAAGGGVEVVNSINPHRIAGQATAAHEIVTDLGDAPDVLALPVGNAGNISAYWRGFNDALAAGAAKRRPIMRGRRFPIRRRWRRQFALGSPPHGRRRSPRATNRADSLTPSPMPRSCARRKRSFALAASS